MKKLIFALIAFFGFLANPAWATTSAQQYNGVYQCSFYYIPSYIKAQNFMALIAHADGTAGLAPLAIAVPNASPTATMLSGAWGGQISGNTLAGANSLALTFATNAQGTVTMNGTFPDLFGGGAPMTTSCTQVVGNIGSQYDGAYLCTFSHPTVGMLYATTSTMYWFFVEQPSTGVAAFAPIIAPVAHPGNGVFSGYSFGSMNGTNYTDTTGQLYSPMNMTFSSQTGGGWSISGGFTGGSYTPMPGSCSQIF